MEVMRCVKAAFCVIGREGSTEEGAGFIQRLWAEANAHFDEVAPLAKRDEQGNPLGYWGAMTDFSRSFRPWEDGFSKGLYLAGVEAEDDALPPPGWARWTIPAFEYLYVKSEGLDTFPRMIAYLRENGIALAGAVHDFNCPETGEAYMFFPVSRLKN